MSDSRTSPTIKPLLIGLSGPSSSGKTTLARLLRSIFNFTIPITQSSISTPMSVNLHLSILHQDDFYHTDARIPVITTPPDCPSGLGARELQDWDCIESLDLDLFERTLRVIKDEGRIPEGEGWSSKEDLNSVGESRVSEDEVGRWRREVEGWIGEVMERMRTRTRRSKEQTGIEDGDGTRHAHGGGGVGETAMRQIPNTMDTSVPTAPPPADTETLRIRIFLLDGFLLYPDPSLATTTLSAPQPPSQSQASSESTPNHHQHQLLQTQLHRTTSLLNTKLFLPCTRAQTIARRARRSGYVTLEGFWADPPGYVEDVVWSGYVRDHAWMLRDGKKEQEQEQEQEQKGGEQGEKSGGEDEGVVDVDAAAKAGIDVVPGMGSWDMSRLVEWGVGRVRRGMEEMLVKDGLV